jgi:hypothetical protein
MLLLGSERKKKKNVEPDIKCGILVNSRTDK